jgi:hypothetical protein
MDCNTQNQPQRCDCHKCTQARWKMSLQGQIMSAVTVTNTPADHYCLCGVDTNVNTQGICLGCGKPIWRRG